MSVEHHAPIRAALIRRARAAADPLGLAALALAIALFLLMAVGMLAAHQAGRW